MQAPDISGPESGRVRRALTRFADRLGIEPAEHAAVAWSFVYFFCLLSSYFILRSIRETMAVVNGVQNIPWLFTGTFVLMLLATPVFGWLTSRFPRRTFLPWIYYFFILNIFIFFAVFTEAQSSGRSQAWVSRAFFVWLSVFNLFIVSVFWSFMADIYSRAQSRRLFGIISAGGSAGALAGPIATRELVVAVGFQNLLPVSAALLMMAVVCVYRLRHLDGVHTPQPAASMPASPDGRSIGGGALAGMRLVLTTPYFLAIALALACANFLGGFAYIYIAHLVSENVVGADLQTRFFANQNVIINLIALLLQAFVVKFAIRRFGIGGTLTILPLVLAVGFAALSMYPGFIAMAALQITQRSLGFGFNKPVNDMLYGVVSREAKYKAKNFIETSVYRGWDVLVSWTVRSMGGMGLSGIALICVPIAIAWSSLVLWIGREYNRRDRAVNA